MAPLHSLRLELASFLVLSVLPGEDLGFKDSFLTVFLIVCLHKVWFTGLKTALLPEACLESVL